MTTFDQKHKAKSAGSTRPGQTFSGQHPKLSSILQLQRSMVPDNQTATDDHTAVLQTINSPGHAVESGVHASMKARLGYDFSRARLHTDARAVKSASMLDAQAYTVGRHVVFGSGQYRPGTVEGDRLLAHELVHSLQQGFSQSHGGINNLPIDDAASQAETQARRLSESALTPGSLPVTHEAPQPGAGACIQRQKKKNKGKQSSFKLNGSGVGNLISSELGRITVTGPKPQNPKVSSQEVLEILNASPSFLMVAEKVEKKYFKDIENPVMKLVFHENEDTGTHFKHDENLMEIFIPDAQPLSTVINSIVHEMVHASRGSPVPEGSKKHGAITRQVQGGISDESATRKSENKIMTEIQKSTEWGTYTGGVKIPTEATSQKDVRVSFVSGKPRFTYQEYFILGAARTKLKSGLSPDLVKLAGETARDMLATGIVESATMDNAKFFQFGKDEIKRHTRLKDKPMPEFKGAEGTMLEQSEREKHQNIRKLSSLFIKFYDAIEKVEEGKKTRQGLQYLGILLVENRIGSAWAGKNVADDKTREEHLNLLKALLPSLLKGISL